MKGNDEKFLLQLYVAGNTQKSMVALSNLKKYCKQYLKNRYRIEIIDLVLRPHLAEGEQIFAIPTLVKKMPKPIIKIIGDLSNEPRVLAGLNISPNP
jgi:circadian clock protein KaiB